MGDRSAEAIPSQSAPDDGHSIIWVASEPQPKASRPAPMSAAEAIRERERRTRERWDAERAHQQTEVHHHYYHQHQVVVPPFTPTEEPESAAGNDDIVDAEVVENSESTNRSTRAVGPAEPAALPPATPPDSWITNNTQEVRRDER